MKVMKTIGAVRCAQLQSNCHHQQFHLHWNSNITNIHLLQARCPSWHPTNSVKSLKRKFHIQQTCSPQPHLGSSNLVFEGSWRPWGRVAKLMDSPVPNCHPRNTVISSLAVSSHSTAGIVTLTRLFPWLGWLSIINIPIHISLVCKIWCLKSQTAAVALWLRRTWVQVLLLPILSHWWVASGSTTCQNCSHDQKLPLHMHVQASLTSYGVCICKSKSVHLGSSPGKLETSDPSP